MSQKKKVEPENPLQEEPQSGGILPPPNSAFPSFPSREERLAAAAAHGGILLNLLTGIGGLVLALVLWLHYEDRSKYASWHALQALVFQGVVLLAGLVVGGIAAGLWLLTLLLRPLVIGYCFLPFTLGFSLVFAFIFLGSLLYGCAGALTTLNGRDFNYRWVSGWIYQRQP